MSTPHYSPLIDRYIYGVQDGCATRQEWVDLAFAALDQAGVSEPFYKTLYARVDEAFGFELREELPFAKSEPPPPSQAAQRALNVERDELPTFGVSQRWDGGLHNRPGTEHNPEGR